NAAEDDAGTEEGESGSRAGLPVRRPRRRSGIRRRYGDDGRISVEAKRQQHPLVAAVARPPDFDWPGNTASNVARVDGGRLPRVAAGRSAARTGWWPANSIGDADAGLARHGICVVAA